MGILYFLTYAVDMKECNAPESNNTSAEVSLIKHGPMTTSGAFWSFLGLLLCDVIELPANIVLSSSNRNGISSTGRGRGGHSYLRRTVARIGALVGKVTFIPTSVALPFIL
jgi:hypothetical protein